MPYHSSVSLKKSVSNVKDWQHTVQYMDLNRIHKQRKCEISIIMENDPKAVTYIRQLSSSNIIDDTIIVIDVQELHNYFNYIMFKMPEYIDPITSKLFTNIFTSMSVVDLEKLMESSTTTKIIMVKLRILCALKQHIFKYEDPIRRREAFREEYKLLIDVQQETGGAEFKKKGSKTKKNQKAKQAKSKSSKSSQSSKKGKKKGVDKSFKLEKVEEPCLMLENNVRKPSRQLRWNSVVLKPRTLQILIANCYNFDYLHLLTEINVPIKCLLEVSLPSIAYPEILIKTETSLRGQASNISIASFEGKTTTFASSRVALSLSPYNTLLNPSRPDMHDVFWKEFERTIHNAPTHISNLYYMKYVPIDMPIEEHLPFYEEQCLLTYDEIKYLLESTEIIKRMHKTYYNSIKEYCTVVDPEKPNKAICYKKYSETLDCLPPDVCTVPIILDALLNEVEVQVAPTSDLNNEGSTHNELLKKKSSAADIIQQRPKYYGTRNFLATVLKQYRMYSVVDNFVPICNSIDNVLLNIKIDKNQIRMHENNKMVQRFHSYLNIRTPLSETFLNVIKRQPLCNFLKKSFASECVKNCNEINNLSSRLNLDVDQVMIYLGIIMFNLINWFAYNHHLRNRAKVDCNEELKKLFQIITGQKADELKYCDSIIESENCKNVYKNLDIIFYENLSKSEMLQELNSNCHQYNSIKYYYCSLLDSLLIEFDNKLNDFGISHFNWMCSLRTIPNLVKFSKNVLYEETRWLTQQEMKYQKLLEAKQEVNKKSENELKNANQQFHEDKLQEVSFILKNTLKDVVLLNVALPETKDDDVQKKQNVKKPDKPVKITTSKMRQSKGSIYSVRSSGISKGSVLSTTSKHQDLATEKVFFAESGCPVHTKITGSTTSFVSKDGVQITYDTHNGDNYNSLNIDLNGDHFIMHKTKDEYFKFHFYLQNDIIINFVKPVNKSVVDHVKTDKLYTVFRNYNYRLNNFHRFVKKQSTYLISDDVLDRIRTNMRKNPKSETRELTGTSTVSKTSLEIANHGDNEKKSSEETQRIGDIIIHELKTKEHALEKLKQAEAGQQPVFKICSSKLHQFNYISRKKSHAKFNYKDAVEEIVNVPDPPIQHRYLFRELVGSIDNDDVASNMPYNYTVTLPTSLTVRSEVDIQGNQQIKQFYIDKGPQLRDIYAEVSRTFTHNGDMIIKLNDGQVKILSSTGDIIQFEAPLFDRSRESKVKKKVKRYDEYMRALRRLTNCYHKHTLQRICVNSSRKQARHKQYQYISSKSLLIAKQYKFPYPIYSIMHIDGSKISFRDGKYVHTRDHYPALEEDVIYGTFKCTGQDGITTELTRNGDSITTFPDKTVLIISFEIDEKPVFVDINKELLNEHGTSDDTELIRCSDFVLIHSSKEFRHPKYATVKMGGISNMTEILLPCDISLQNIGEDFKLKINPNVAAVFNTSKIEVSTNFCSICKGGTNTIINIEDLYLNNSHVQTKFSKAFVIFRDSFNRYLEILPCGKFTNNEDFERGLNMHQCTTHRTFNTKKFYILKKKFSGFRLWPRQSYIHRLLRSLKCSDSIPDLRVQQVDDIYFLLKNFVLLFNKYLMEPASSDTYYESYRFLQKMPYNKHTNFLLREAENAILGTVSPMIEAPEQQERDPTSDRLSSDLELTNVSTVTLFQTDTPKFESLPQLTIQDCVTERYDGIRRICQKRWDRIAAQRAKIDDPINYFLYKETLETEERLREQLIHECLTSSNLKLTHKKMQLILSNSDESSENDAISNCVSDQSIQLIFSGYELGFKSEVFAVKSYVSTKRYPSINIKYARTYSSANLIKQRSALNLLEFSTLIDVYHLNNLSDHRIQKKHKYSDSNIDI